MIYHGFKVAWWHKGFGIELVIQRSLVPLPVGARLCNNSGQVVQTPMLLDTKQDNLVPVNGWSQPATGKVTVGLTSHWPCITDFRGLTA